MSEQRSGTKRIVLYVLAAVAVAVIAWIIFRGTNVFNYIDRANELGQEQADQQE